MRVWFLFMIFVSILATLISFNLESFFAGGGGVSCQKLLTLGVLRGLCLVFKCHRMLRCVIG